LQYQVRGHWAYAPLKNPESGTGGERHMERATPSVLIVDDDASVRRIMVELVKSRGYRVEEASDGEDAWRQLQRERLDLVVSDLQMPLCDGRELCRRIRSEPSFRDIRVVIISGCIDVLDDEHLECDSVLTKPVSVPMLLREIELARRPEFATISCATVPLA
jgi:CheY-like chemotaxis protein